MGQFACISFEEDNIIVSKEKSFRHPHPKIKLEDQVIAGASGYKVNVPMSLKKYPAKYWDKLEKELLLRNVGYVCMEPVEKYFNPFKEIEVVMGEEILPLLSFLILDYIYKYNLIETGPLDTKVGIITGRTNETIDLIGNIMDEVVDLTLYTNEPLEYKEVIQELNKRKRLRVRAVDPKPEMLKASHIIFDLNGTGQYALGCDPKTIYVDYKNQTRKYIQQFIAPQIGRAHV